MITRKDIQNRLNIVCSMLGRANTEYNKDGTKNEGALTLDHNAIYDGYLIEMMCDGGGTHVIWGRGSAVECYAYLQGVLDGLNINRDSANFKRYLSQRMKQQKFDF